MSLARHFWGGSLLTAFLLGLACGGGNGPTTPPPPPPPDEVFEWSSPDSLRNIVAAPVRLELDVQGDVMTDTLSYVRLFADGELLAQIYDGPYEFSWEQAAGATIGYHQLEAVGYNDDDLPIEERALTVLIQEDASLNYIGGSGSDAAYDLARLSDGSIVMTGDYISVDGYSRGFLFGINAQAGERWFRLYGAGESHLRAVAPMSDGGIALAGWTWNEPNRGWSMQWLFKTSARGWKEWNSSYTIYYALDDYAHDMVPAQDGGYVLAGRSQAPDFRGGFLLKASLEGNPVWSRPMGVGAIIYSVIPVSGGYVATGLQESETGTVLLLSRRVVGGDEIWTQTYDEAGNFSVGRRVIPASGGGFVIAGGTDNDLMLLKTDESGNPQWIRTYGDSGWDLGLSVAATADGGYILCGLTTPPGLEEPDLCLVKTDADGIQQWKQSYHGPGRDVAYDVIQLDAGGYYVAGESEIAGDGSTDAWLLETDSAGEPRGRVLTPNRAE